MENNKFYEMPEGEYKPGETFKVGREIPQPITSTLVITCYCGLARLLPEGLEVGDRVLLSPCPKCGAPFDGVLVDPHRIDSNL